MSNKNSNSPDRLPLLLLRPGLCFAFAVAWLLIFSAFKASRAPQLDAAKEARMFERSEFRAVPFPARSTGNRCGFIASASVRRKWFWLLLPKQK
jgi:hypothetical protein